MPSPSFMPAAIKAGEKSALVSGASFAGLATAYCLLPTAYWLNWLNWLNWLGHSVTIVETAGGLRRGGTPVDIEGETIELISALVFGRSAKSTMIIVIEASNVG